MLFRSRVIKNVKLKIIREEDDFEIVQYCLNVKKFNMVFGAVIFESIILKPSILGTLPIGESILNAEILP